jgi:hypothetical protein
MNYTVQEIVIGDQIKNEMGRAYGMYVWKENVYWVFTVQLFSDTLSSVAAMLTVC